MKPIFCIKDRAIDSYGDPFAQPSAQHAVRWFRDLVNDQTTPFAKHPDDYDLYTIAEYDDLKGHVHAIDHPTLVARAKDLINPTGA